MARLNFSVQTSRATDTRTKPTKYNKSTLRNIFRDLGPGDNLSDVYYPYKYLPAQMQDTTTEDFIVIPKGRVVSLLTHYDTTEPSGIPTPSGAGSIEIAVNKLTNSTMTSLIDDAFYGYPNHVAGLLVMANGGVLATGQYTSRDVTACTVDTVTALTAGPVIQINYPIGVIAGDVYQDIRGKNLNYQMWDKAVTVITDWYIEVPYVKIGQDLTGDKTKDPSTPEEIGTSMTFDTMNSKYTYMTLLNGDKYKAGVTVTCDTRGNYKLMSSQATTIQSIGKLILTDCRFPKDMLELVDTYEGSSMPGTDTAGIPSYLFNFAHDYLVAVSAGHTLANVVTAIQGGQFGAARMLINI